MNRIGPTRPAARARAAALLLLVFLVWISGACHAPQDADSPAALAAPSGRRGPPEEAARPDEPPPSPVTVPPGQWLPLSGSENGQDLEGWRVVTEADFAKRGEVRVADGCLVLAEGGPFTGIVWTGEFPREGYEISLQARRRSGGDIFCGLTVPVGDSHVTLVLGGWSNTVVGLSNVDHRYARDNDTTRFQSFDNDLWYDVRLRVTTRRILAWVDGEKVVDQKREGHVFTIYYELEPIRPLGFFSWMTEAALRRIRMRRLGAGEEDEENTGGP